MRSRHWPRSRRRLLAELDRFEDYGLAVLVDEHGREMSVPADQLPPGSKQGDWLKLEFCGSAVTGAAVDEDETEARRKRIEEKMARLRGQS
jgi:hypothetical protein